MFLHNVSESFRAWGMLKDSPPFLSWSPFFPECEFQNCSYREFQLEVFIVLAPTQAVSRIKSWVLKSISRPSLENLEFLMM